MSKLKILFNHIFIKDIDTSKFKIEFIVPILFYLTNTIKIEQEEEKLIRMKQLVQNGVVSEIKKLENKIKIQKKDTKFERKKEVLENQGLPMNIFNEENEEEKKPESNNNSTNKLNSEINNNNNYINNINKQFLSK